MSRKIFSFACLLCLFTVLRADPQKSYESACAAQQTCSHCLQTPYCVWCSETHSNQNNGSLIRCATRDKLMKERDHWCPQKYVEDGNPFISFVENEPLHTIKGKDPVQVQPQKMLLRLKRGEEYNITLRYSKAEDYPVDLYYLMDLSFSMEPYREQLSILGDKLAKAMTQLTSNFRLGFGSFVDKVVLPMTDTQPDMLKSPCVSTITGKPCASPYGFKNQMRLTDNLALFTSRVKEAPVSGNLDGPEGGFDAIMQALVCTNEIGWREKARHLLVFSTDAAYHIAGDGKLAGIIEPNDELCHLDNRGFYSYSTLQDYPSISQINRNVKEHNINIIFAVTEKMNTTYQILSTRISGSSIGLLENNAKNVVSLVSKEYEKLVDSVTIVDNAPEMIDIRYFSKCLDKTGNFKERNECGGLRVGDVVEFQIVLKVVDCPANSEKWRNNINIGPRGLTESLVLDVEIICDCDCEKNKTGIKSPACKEAGDLTCGICQCYDGFYGKQCECKGSDVGTNTFDECKANNESEICSGRGTCKCGVCDCAKRSNPEEQFYGTYCECDNFSCKRSGGFVCGGRGNHCECGTCNCLSGWTGETCDCKDSNTTCMPSAESNVVCSGRGDCICDSCHCHETKDIRYSGQFCEECPTCPGQQCEELKDCVECMAYQSGRLWKNGSCNACLHKLEIMKVEHVEENFANNMDDKARVCRMPVDAGCSIVFKYELVGGSLQDKEKYFRIVIQNEKDCPTPVNVMGVALGVIISTVILGSAILLIWKLFTMIQDRREYARFEKEMALVKWERGDNPFYKKATTTFSNPTFKENPKPQET